MLDLTTIKEIARLALDDPDFVLHVADTLDLSDDAVEEIREALESELSD